MKNSKSEKIDELRKQLQELLDANYAQDLNRLYQAREDSRKLLREHEVWNETFREI